MNIQFVLSIAVTLVGLVLFWVSSNKPMEIGRLMFATGLLATLLLMHGSASLHIGG